MLLNTRFPDTARGAKIVNLYLATGALLAYRADRRHTYDPDTGLRLLAFIDDHFRHIFTNRSLLQADEQLIDCWLEIKRQRLRLQTDIDVELADVREIFDITSTLEKKLSLANKAGLIDYWAEVQDRIEAEVRDRISNSQRLTIVLRSPTGSIQAFTHSTAFSKSSCSRLADISTFS